MTATVIVMPCYNEADRLDVAAVVAMAQEADARLLFVNDGSTDETARVLADARARHAPVVEVLELAMNVGKGEAVRRGMRQAIGGGAEIVGYYDADLSTPPGEMRRLIDEARRRPGLVAVLGARVGLLGHRIERNPWRHYLGRLFATASSAALGLAVYDTQCGAKVFRTDPALDEALREPFRGRWSFDVELLGRLRRAGCDAERFVEVPLRAWSDIHGSKLRPTAAMGAGLQLVRIARDVRRRPPDGD